MKNGKAKLVIVSECDRYLGAVVEEQLPKNIMCEITAVPLKLPSFAIKPTASGLTRIKPIQFMSFIVNGTAVV